jgi:hypothetical protein
VQKVFGTRIAKLDPGVPPLSKKLAKGNDMKLLKQDRRIGQEFKAGMGFEKLSILLGWPVYASDLCMDGDEDEFEEYEREWAWECEKYYDDFDYYYYTTEPRLSIEDGEAAKAAWLSGEDCKPVEWSML